MSNNTAHIGHVSDSELEILRTILRQDDVSGVVIVDDAKANKQRPVDPNPQPVNGSVPYYKPPRPMTEEEKEWYKIHKSLKGFKPETK